MRAVPRRATVSHPVIRVSTCLPNRVDVRRRCLVEIDEMQVARRSDVDCECAFSSEVFDDAVGGCVEGAACEWCDEDGYCA